MHVEYLSQQHVNRIKFKLIFIYYHLFSSLNFIEILLKQLSYLRNVIINIVTHVPISLSRTVVFSDQSIHIKEMIFEIVCLSFAKVKHAGESV